MKQTTKIIAILAVTLAMATPAISAAQATTEKKTEPAEINVIKIPSADSDTKKTEAAPAKTEAKPVTEPAKASPAKTKQTTPNKATKVDKAAQTNIKTPKGQGTILTSEDYFVSVEWLKKNIKSCILIDCRPNSLYKSGHIPGAINAEWTYFAKVNVPNGTEKWGTILSPESLSKRISALGINDKKPIVVYCDAKGWGQSGWALWVLRQAGLKNIYELDGGLSEWKLQGGAVTKTETKAKPVPFKVTNYLPHFSIDTAALSEKLQDFYIIDVRTKAEYDGKIRPFQEKRAGHIPGAINIEKDNFVDDENLVKSKERIDELLAAVGIGKDKPIVVYDTAGVRSAFVSMILSRVGYKSINYDPGFQAWAGNPDLPVEK